MLSLTFSNDWITASQNLLIWVCIGFLLVYCMDCHFCTIQPRTQESLKSWIPYNDDKYDQIQFLVNLKLEVHLPAKQSSVVLLKKRGWNNLHREVSKCKDFKPIILQQNKMYRCATVSAIGLTWARKNQGNISARALNSSIILTSIPSWYRLQM